MHNNRETEAYTSLPRFNADYQFVQQLIIGNSDAWNKFYKESRNKLERYIHDKYPNVFSDIAKEEICDGVLKRIIENDYKALKDYRGDCTFSRYITNATDWEIKDWLRKHSDELLNEPIDDNIRNNAHADVKTENEFLREDITNIPEVIKCLSDDLRWAFLLRYYDYFGFPLEEMRLLAQKKGVLIGSITKKIVNLLEPQGKDILRNQIEKQKTFQLRLQKVCLGIHELDKRERRILTESVNNCDPEQNVEISSEKRDVIRNKRIRLEEKRKILLNSSIKSPITTPYEIIAEILEENNVSTIRSRVFFAKKQLKEKLFNKSE